MKTEGVERRERKGQMNYQHPIFCSGQVSKYLIGEMFLQPDQSIVFQADY